MKRASIFLIMVTGLMSTGTSFGQNVGVDESLPLEKLHINGAIKVGTTANLPPGGAGTIRWNGTNFEGWDGSQWIDFGSSGDLDWVINGAEIYNANTGNVGVGTATPSHKLDVVGDVNVSTGQGFRIGGTATAGEYLRGNGTRFVSATIPYTDITGTPTSLPPNGLAGGDLNGTYPNPGVNNSQYFITSAGTTGQVWISDGAGAGNWGTDQNTTYSAGNQLTLSGTTFNVAEGAGSGLDADLLDGNQGAYYLDANNHDYDGGVTLPSSSVESAIDALDVSVSNITDDWTQAGTFLRPNNITWDIGIGTTTPAEKLHVVGITRISTVASGSNGAVVLSNNVGNLDKVNLTGDVDDVFIGDGTFVPASTFADDDWYKVTTTVAPDDINDNIYTHGKVGIGAITPAVSLHISDAASEQIRIQTSGTEADIHYVNSGSTWQVGTNDAGNGTGGNQFYVYDGNYRLTVQKGTGYVGVGTATAPEVPFHVKANSAGTAGQLLVSPASGSIQDGIMVIRGARNAIAPSQTARLRFENYDVDDGSIHTMGNIGGVLTDGATNVGDIVLYTSLDGLVTSLSETMRLTKEGNVGIGNIVPTQKLDVNGQIRMRTGASNGFIPISTADGTMVWTDPAAYTGDISGVTAGDGLVGGGLNGDLTLDVVALNGLTDAADDIRLGGSLVEPTLITQGAHAMTFNLSGAGDFDIQDNSTSAFFVRDDGNIGINTTAPGYKLEVVGDMRGTSSVFFGTSGAALSGTNQGGSIELGPGNSAGGEIPFIDFHHGVGSAQDYNYRIINSGNNQLNFSSNAGQTIYFDNGSLGVGISPLAKLHVSGNARVSSLIGTGNRVVYAEPDGTLTTSSGGSAPASSSLSGGVSNYPVDYNATATHLNLTSNSGGAGTTVSATMDVNGNILVVANVTAAAGNGNSPSPALIAGGPFVTVCPCTGDIQYFKYPYTNTGNPTPQPNPGIFPYWGTATYTLELQESVNGSPFATVMKGSTIVGIQVPDAYLITNNLVNNAGIFGNRFGFSGNVSLNYVKTGAVAGSTYTYKLLFTPGGGNKAAGAYYIGDRTLNVVPLR